MLEINFLGWIQALNFRVRISDRNQIRVEEFFRETLFQFGNHIVTDLRVENERTIQSKFDCRANEARSIDRENEKNKEIER